MLRSLVLSLSLLIAAPASAEVPRSVREDALRARFGPAVEVSWNPLRTAPRRLSRLSIATEGADAGERARGFMLANAALLGLEGDVAIDEVREISPPTQADRPAAARFRVVRLSQRWSGLPVEGRSVVVRLDGDDRVTSVTSDLGPLSVPMPAHMIDAAAAKAKVMATYPIVGASEPTRVVLARGNSGRIAWKIAVAVVPLQALFFVWLDAETGEVMKEAPAALDQTMRELPRRAEVTP